MGCVYSMRVFTWGDNDKTLSEMGDMDINGSVHSRRHENVAWTDPFTVQKATNDILFKNIFPFSFQVCMGFRIQSTVPQVVRKYV